MSRKALARLSNVGVTFDGGRSWVFRHVGLTVREGEFVALTGANGAGKTTLARLVAGLLAPDEGRVELAGRTVFDAAGPHPAAYRRARRSIGMVFQDPRDQILTTRVAEDVAFGPENLSLPGRELAGRVGGALSEVGLARLCNADPGRLSGGQQQLVAIAGMLAMRPALLVLDEPTAMLDGPSRGRVLEVLDRLHKRGTAILLTSHDPRVVGRAGRIVRLGPADRSLRTAPPPSTSPREGGAAGRGAHPVVLSARNISYRYGRKGPWVLRGASLTLRAGRIVALTGPNGSGKSTLARILALLRRPAGGTLRLAGTTIRAGGRVPSRTLRRLRGMIGYAMQEPQRQLFAPTVRADVSFGPRNLLPRRGEERRGRLVDATLRLLGVEDLADRSPFRLSGGQQRLVALAGVLAYRPHILILDEPSAGLDAASAGRLHRALLRSAAAGAAILLITHSSSEIRDLHAEEKTMSAVNPGESAPAGEGTRAPGERRAERESFLARTDPRSTLLVTLAAMAGAFTLHTPLQLLAASLAAALLLAAGRVRLGRLLRVLHPLLPVLLLVAVVNMLVVRTGPPLLTAGPLALTLGGARAGIVYSARLLLVLLLGSSVVESQSPTRLADGLTGLLTPLRTLGVHTQEIGLVLLLALRFLPLLSREASDIALAQTSRGGDIASGSPAKRLQAMSALLLPLFSACIRHAQNTSLSLDARCYEEGIKRTHLSPLRLSWRDGVLAACAAVFLAALVGLGWAGV